VEESEGRKEEMRERERDKLENEWIGLNELPSQSKLVIFFPTPQISLYLMIQISPYFA
jgi:hypothetical protein